MIIDGVIALLLLVGLVLLFSGPWQTIWTDIGRQALFESRDAIFDMALAGKFSFADPNYRLIRTSIERTIRYAHDLTCLQLALAMAYEHLQERRYGPRSEPDSLSLSQAIASIKDDAVRAEVAKQVDKGYQILIACMVMKSPLALLLLPATIAAMIFRRAPITDQVRNTSVAIQKESELMAA